MNTLKLGDPSHALVVAFIAVALLSLPAGPALAAVQPVEHIRRVTNVGHPSADLGLVESRLVFPAGARWEMDPEAGPLTLTVESGKVGVSLGGGLARIERDASPLREADFHRLEPSRMAVLWPGDTLVVVRGYQLHVDNDDRIATMHVTRIVRSPLPIVATGERPGQPR